MIWGNDYDDNDDQIEEDVDNMMIIVTVMILSRDAMIDALSMYLTSDAFMGWFFL